MGNSSTTTGTMKAAVRQSGEIVFNPSYNIPKDPKPNSDGVIVRVKAAAVNPIDYKLPKMMGGAVVGFDVAGIIEKIAEGNVTHNFKVGDEVYGHAAGSLAEFAPAKASRIALKPKELSFVQASSMNVTYITSLQALRTHGGLKAGGRVLIIGASGGAGSAGIQIAKALKASEIVAICSGKNEDMVRNLGATNFIDYKTTSFAEVYSAAIDDDKFDVVYDCASHSGHGEDYAEEARAVLRVGPPAGMYIPLNGTLMQWLRSSVKWQAANTHLFVGDPTTADLNIISKLVSEEGLRPVIAETLPFTAEGLDTAFSHLKSRRTVGKITLDMTLESKDSVEDVKKPEVKQQSVADANGSLAVNVGEKKEQSVADAGAQKVANVQDDVKIKVEPVTAEQAADGADKVIADA